MALRETSKKNRFLNFVIDMIALGGLIQVTLMLEESINFLIPIEATIFIMGGIYYIFMEFFLGKTIGKYVTKSKVVDRNGDNIDFRAAFTRYACRWIPFEYISLLLGADARAWHDLLSKTLVVDDKPYSNDVLDIEQVEENQEETSNE